MPSVLCSVCQCEISLELGHLAAAACGHTFHSNCLNEWLQRGSKTCPVCRKATKSSLVLFIDFAPEAQDASDSRSSTDVLKCRIDSLEFELKVKEEEKKKAEEKAIMLERNKKDLRQEAKRFETQYKTELDKRKSLESQVQYITKELSVATGFRDEAQRLRAQLESLKSAKLLLQGTENDVEEMMSSYKDKSEEMRSLATYCIMLKKELVKSQESKQDRIEELVKCQRENGTLKSRLAKAEKVAENLENDFCRLDSENIELKKKIEELRGKRRLSSKRLDLEDSIQVLNKSDVEVLQKKVKKNSDENQCPVGEKKSELTSKTSLRQPEEKAKVLDSAFLATSSSSSSATTSSSASNSDIDLSHLSIMKKRPTLNLNRPKENSNRDIGFDGMGGSSKPDIFPEPKRSGGLMKFVKIKSGNTVKVAKVSSVITLD